MELLQDWLLQPVGFISLGLVLTLASWTAYGAKPRLPFCLLLLSTMSMLVLSMPEVANSMVARIENARTNPTLCTDASDAPIVVLGGDIDLYAPSQSPFEILGTDSLIRVLRAPEFASNTSQFFLVGGGSAERKIGPAMKSILMQLGIEAERIHVETVSRSTYENAQELAKLAGPDIMPVINLVTSALHTNRAAKTFEQAGYQVCHHGVDSLYSVPALPVSLLPYLSGLSKSTRALHEWLGTYVYRIKGYM